MSGSDQNQDVGSQLFQFFNELGIIQQLATTYFNKHMPGGLHIAHFTVINHLTRLGDGKNPAQIASAIQVTKATMTHALGILQTKGFIEIKPNPSDGRSKLVYLTPAGIQFRTDAIKAISPALKLISENCEVSEIAKTIPTLENVRKVLDENRG